MNLLAELLDDDQWTRSAISHDLSGAQLRRLDVAECRFIGCRLTGADLQGARLVDVEFVDCEMSGVSMAEAVFTRVVLRNCRLSGVGGGLEFNNRGAGQVPPAVSDVPVPPQP